MTDTKEIQDQGEQILRDCPYTACAGKKSPWVRIEDRCEMPKHGKNVNVTYKNNCDRRRVVVGHYLEQYKEESTGEEEANDEYCEADDVYYYKAGWYEQQDNCGDYSSIAITEGTPDYWQEIELPKG